MKTKNHRRKCYKHVRQSIYIRDLGLDTDCDMESSSKSIILI